MEFRALKQSMEKIELSDEMQNRIIRNCRLSELHEMEEITMKTRKYFDFKKAMFIAAAVVLCLSVSIAAANHSGFFQDVRNWNGAVTGTKYVQATEEINLFAAAGGDALIVTATLLTPETAPYSFLDTFAIDRYQIIDASGNVIVDGKSDDFVRISESTAKMTVPLDGVHKGNYKLVVSSFIGSSKADQPLKISGNWEFGFTV